MNGLKKNIVDPDCTEIPRPAECLKYIIKVAGLDLRTTLKQSCVRPYVLVQSPYHVIWKYFDPPIFLHTFRQQSKFPTVLNWVV